jgi:hypothetical protein
VARHGQHCIVGEDLTHPGHRSDSGGQRSTVGRHRMMDESFSCAGRPAR